MNAGVTIMKWTTVGEHIFDNRRPNTRTSFRVRIDSDDAAKIVNTLRLLGERTAEAPVAPKRASRMHINVGGTHFEIARALLVRLPRTRLGRLACLLEESSDPSPDALLNYCDDFRLSTDASNGSGTRNSSEKFESSDCPTFYFERDATALPMLLYFYRTGKLHVALGMCVINFAEELEYWKIKTVCTCLTYFSFIKKYQTFVSLL